MRIDLHVHTHFSPDALSTPERLAAAAKRKGLDGIAVTDHNTTAGWKRMLAAGKREGILVIRGEEVKVSHDGRAIGEVLALFIGEEIRPGEFPEVRDMVRRQGGILVVAHPFDSFRNSFAMAEEYRKDFGAVEALNSRAVLDRFNRKAAEFASRNGLPVTGGSDAHCCHEVGKAWTAAEARDLAGFERALRAGKTATGGGRSNPLIHIVSTIAKTGIGKGR